MRPKAQAAQAVHLQLVSRALCFNAGARFHFVQRWLAQCALSACHACQTVRQDNLQGEISSRNRHSSLARRAIQLVQTASQLQLRLGGVARAAWLCLVVPPTDRAARPRTSPQRSLASPHSYMFVVSDVCGHLGKLGPHLVPTWSPRGPHTVPTWSPLGPHVVPTWFSPGPRVGTTWGPRGDHVGTTWGPRGDRVGATWGPRGDRVGATWGPRGGPGRHRVGTEWGAPRWGPRRGNHLVPARFPLGSHRVPTWSPRGSHLVPTWFPPGHT